LTLSGGFQAIATSGHLAYWQPQRRILFCDDALFCTLSRHPSGLRLPFELFTVDIGENIRSVKRLAALEPSIICFGHGQPMMKGSAATLRACAEAL
jgi:glyoxylase-like metal-dependent hydrolase (beta-lactamase superfamily II)